jgi:hypothetical protein
MNEEMEVNFCALVSKWAFKYYGVEDGDDLCFNLIESGVIAEDTTVSEAARIVAMHIQQA